MNREIFREYDIRGVVETDFTPDVVTNIGKAYGTRVINAGGKSVSIGRDIRLTGPALFDSLSSGILSTGCSVVDIGAVPTPLLYFSQFELDVQGGIMITGSHNPPEYNGFKMLINKKSVHGAEIQELMKEIEAGDFKVGAGELTSADVTSPYKKMIKGKISISRPVKVVIDSGNGCGGLVAPELLRELGCEVIDIYTEPDGTFPNHHPDPTVEANMGDLKKVVLEHNAEVGIGYDGDADRIGLIDEKGEQHHGDELLMIFAKDMLSRNKGAKVVFDIKCTRNLPVYVEKHGGVPVICSTGHSLIKQKLNDEGALLAGEMSAHIFFAEDYYGFDDAIYATARMLKIISIADKPVSEFLSDLPKTFNTPEIRVDCPDSEKFGLVKELVEFYRSKYKIIDIDGVRIEFDNGWGLVRASNTGPILVLRFEAETLEDMNAYKKEVYNKLKTFAPLKDLKPF